ncbi:MAG TPA: hypothetical protein VMY16_06815 [Ilumatobacteraceae bacterium]|nr:hypothetical protein [Ilumatobacteraceae bacterium]
MNPVVMSMVVMPVIQAMLGVSEQAAKRKYAAKISAQSPAEVDGSGAHFAHPIPSTTRSRAGDMRPRTATVRGIAS